MVKSQKENNVKILTDDLIFKELIRRGYSLKGNTRVWNIADSKLWYLTPEQIELGEELDKDPIYKRNNDEEIELFDNYLKEFKKDIKGPFNFVDLGCNGKKVIDIIKRLLKLNIPFNYCPLDINPLMLSRIEKVFQEYEKENNTNIPFIPINADFYELDEALEKLKSEKYPQNVLFMARDTFVNFEPNEILYNIRQAMDKKDVFILTSSVYHRSWWSKRAKEYKSGGKLDLFAFKTLELLGLKKNEVSFSVNFVENRLEISYILKKDKKIIYDGKSVALKKNDRFLVILAYKHFQEDLLTYLNIHFNKVNTSLSHNKIYILASLKI